MKRREELAQTYLQQADGNPRRALEALQRAFEEVSLEDAREFVSHLQARDILTKMAEQEK